jgi:hypothetical protein
MQVIIDQVTARVRAMEGGAALSQETLRQIVAAVIQAIDARDRNTASENEELSQRNYQQRNRPWLR